MPETSTQLPVVVQPHPSAPQAAMTVVSDVGAAPGDRLTVALFFVFFAILGFAVLADLLTGLVRWLRFFS